jgi:hypothetical protein
MTENPSPYEAAFPELVGALHPRLRAYFGAIPQGFSGHGRGTFVTVGTPRRWLWPVLSILRRQGVLFDAWERDVPFTIVNRPIVDDNGHVAVTAVRSFELDRGEQQMIDAITAEPVGLVDHLGVHRRYAAGLVADVIDGALRVGRGHLPLPRPLSPRVSLTERFDDATGRQQVSVTLDAPLIGRIYEYSGSFEYSILPDASSPEATMETTS